MPEGSERPAAPPHVEASLAARREDAAERYRAVDGSLVEIPPLRPLTPEQEASLRSVAAKGRATLTIKLSIGWEGDPQLQAIKSYLAAPNADLRQLERLDLERSAAPGGDAARPVRPGDLMRGLLKASYALSFSPEAYPQAAVWPLIAQNFDALDEVFDAVPESHLEAMAVAFLTATPKTPMRYLAALLRAGLEPQRAQGAGRGAKAEMRQRARRALAAAPMAGVALLATLDDAAPTLRASAADWLGARGGDGVAKALQRRLAQEEVLAARAALVDALDRLGETVPLALDRETLLREAEAATPKSSKLLSAMARNLPEPRFRDGAAASPKVVKWLVGQAIAIEKPGGDGLIDRYLDLFEPKEARRFSSWALQAWLDYDTAKPTDEEASKKALKSFYGAPPPEHSEAFQKAKAKMFAKYARNGYSSRGVLALAALSPDPEAGFAIRRYLDRHGLRRGSRAAQGAALLALAARIAGPACLETLAWTSRQTKHQALAAEAADLLERIRLERGWTPDELADRIAPDLGFDAEGALDLPVREGAPPYRARLTDTLELRLFNPSGRAVKALPAGKDEDVKGARKRLSELKKSLAATVAAQTDRLFAAMCFERAWPLEAWRRFIQQHPVLGRMAQRLVWIGVGPGAAADGVAFRPTQEGDATSAEDAPVGLGAFETIRVAHGSFLSAAAEAAWPAHFADYEVIPLFGQFGRALLTLEPTPAATEARLPARAGWRMDSATLMREAGRRGFAPAATGRSFYEYDFPTLRRAVGEVVVSLDAQGPPPQQGGAVTLAPLTFNRPLRLLPPILLSEIWRDLLEITAAASPPS